MEWKIKINHNWKGGEREKKERSLNIYSHYTLENEYHSLKSTACFHIKKEINKMRREKEIFPNK